jgi:hypothetical protein
MKMLTLFAAVAATLVFAGAELKAAPIGPLHVAPDAGVVLVAQGCGTGWHRGPYGGCRRNLSPAWPCWWVRGPYGRWRLVCH